MLGRRDTAPLSWALAMHKLRIYRLILGAISPPIIGVCLGLIFAEVTSKQPSPFNIVELLGIFLLGFIFAGLQSAMYSLIMEFIVQRYKNNLQLFFIFSMALGGLAGLSLIVLFGFNINVFLIGIMVGALVGYVLYYLSKGKS